MVKFNFYPQWKSNSVEMWLSEMEQNGYRLNKIVFYYFFHFVKANPRETRYLFLYHFFEKHSAMFDCENELKSHGENKVDANGLYNSIFYRITNSEHDLADVMLCRKVYLENICLRNAILALVVAAACIFMCIVASNELKAAAFLSAGFIAMCLISLFLFIWNVVGLVYLRVEG